MDVERAILAAECVCEAWRQCVCARERGGSIPFQRECVVCCVVDHSNSVMMHGSWERRQSFGGSKASWARL